MATFAITENVTQPYQGNTGPVSLFNQGPSTIYLSTTPGADILNGFTLPPNGQMQWNGSTPLFAVCRTGMAATLVAEPGTGSLDANRSKFWSPIRSESYNNLNQFHTGQTSEVAHCETLQLNLTYKDILVNTTPPWFAVFVTWYDTNQNLIFTEEIDAWCLFFSQVNNGVLSMNIPVQGAFVSFLFEGEAGSTSFPQLISYSLLGTDKVFPYTYYCTNADGSTGPVVAYIEGLSPVGGVLDNVQLSLPNNLPNIYLASRGQRMSFNHNVAGITVAGSRSLRTGSGLTVYFTTSIAVGANNIYQDLLVPVKSLIKETNSTAAGPNSATINVTWAP